MIDPGTLLAVLQIAGKVVAVCHEYLLGVKNAPREISRILDEVTSLRNIIEQLIQFINETEASSSSSLPGLTGTDASLQRCLAELSDLETIIDPKKNHRSLSSKLVWPLKQRETDAKLATLATIKSTLQLALTADNTQKLSKIHANTISIPFVQEQVSGLTKLAEDAVKDEDRQQTINRLEGREQAQKHRLHLEKRVDGTGDWILRHDSYVKWFQNAGGLLWIRGKAGCGKTVLCSNIIDNLEKLCIHENTAVIYFYVDGSNHLPLNANIMYRTFSSQLVNQVSQLPPGVRYATARRLKDQPKEILDKLLGDIDHLYIVVDGLDECEDSMGVEGVMEFLIEMMDLAKDTIHVIVSSRTAAYSRIDLSDLEVTDLEIGECEDNNDVETVLKSQLRNHPAFKRWPSSLKDQVQATLLHKAQGSIHWITCQLDSLKDCKTTKAVQTKLSDLPKSLESYYIRELARLEYMHGAAVRNAFRWVACSLRPLSVSELAIAISVNLEDEDEPFVDEELTLFDIDGFLDSCSSLLTTYGKSDPINDNQHLFLVFSHFSVLEFLRSDAIKSQSCSKFAITEDTAQSSLAKACMSIIRHSTRSTSLHNLDACLAYTSRFWLQHKQLSNSNDWVSTDAQQHLLAMFDSCKPHYRKWIALSSVDRPWRDQDFHDNDDDETTQPTPLYSAALFGLSEVVRSLLENGEDPNVKDGIYAYALQAASSGGYLTIVKLLLEGEADVNAKGGKFGSAIAAAAANGHREVVSCLLEANADLGMSRQFMSDRRDDPLFVAVSNGHHEICKMLLESGAEDYYAMKGRPCTALHAAVQTGRIDIVKTMLQYERIRQTNHDGSPRIIKTQRSGFCASQYTAAEMGDKEMFRELLAYGISDGDMLRYSARVGDQELLTQALTRIDNIDEAGEVCDHPRALQSAALGGHLVLVRTLLAEGSDINLESDYSSALEASVHGGNLEIAKLLVEAGAKVHDSSSGWKRSRPLSAALSMQRRDFIDLFIAHGADPSPNLHIAAGYGEYRDFKLLHELGANLTYRPSKMPEAEISILQAASFGGSIPIVRYLLDRGVDLEEKTQTYPLIEAVRCQHWSAVNVLLDHGANVNAPPQADHDYGDHGGTHINGNLWPPLPASETALSFAIKHHNEDLAKELLQRGAHGCPQTPLTVGTPLLFALWEEMAEVALMLIDAGADVNRSGTIMKRSKPSYPLMIAAEKGNIQLLAMLLKRGANINQQDSEGFSAVHVAAGCPNTKVLRALIQDHGANPGLCLANGSRPIHSAAAKGTVKHVKILLASGQEVDVQNHAGRTALHWAAENENCKLVELLLEKGADANLKADDAKLTPLDMAFIAKEKPWYQKRKEQGQGMDEKAEKMRSKLKEAMMATRAGEAGRGGSLEY